jgi:ABC-type phosphate transport system substrate-binding protein
MSRTLFPLLLILLLCGTLCTEPAHDGYCIVGSEEFQPILDAWSAAYEKENPAPLHEGRGNDSAKIVLADGICEMAAMTRPLNAKEISAILRQSTEKPPLAIPVAVESLVIVAHREYPANRIDLDTLKRVYTHPESAPGEFSESTPHSLPPFTDRAVWFRQAVLNGEGVSERAIISLGPLSLTDAIAATAKGIGYARMAEMHPGLKTLKLIRRDDDRSVGSESAEAGGLPARDYYIYIRRERKASPQTIAFLRFILSERGQRMLIPMGLTPISIQRREAILRML